MHRQATRDWQTGNFPTFQPDTVSRKFKFHFIELMPFLVSARKGPKEAE